MDFASRALGLGLSRMHRTLAARPPSGGRGLVRAAQPALLACLDRLDPDRLGPRCRIARRHIVDRRRLRLDACGDLGFEPDRLGAHGLLTLGATLAASSAARGRGIGMLSRAVATACGGGWLWLLLGSRIQDRIPLTAWFALTLTAVALLTSAIVSYRAYDYSMAQLVFPAGVLGAAVVYRLFRRSRYRRRRARRGSGMSNLRRGLALRSIDGGHGST